MAIKKGWVEITLNKLKKAYWNYKDEDSEVTMDLLDNLENNFKRNGQVENILVRDMGKGIFEVINGNHRYDVAKRLKLKNMMCFNFGKISEVQAKRISVETNETKFHSDQIKLAMTINELVGEFDLGELLSTLPFCENEVENFDKLLNFEMEEVPEDNKKDSTGSGEQSEFKVMRFDLPVQVAEQFEAQVDRFKKVLYPDQKSKDVSYIIPIEAMMQALHQVEDIHITGGES